MCVQESIQNSQIFAGGVLKLDMNLLEVSCFVLVCTGAVCSGARLLIEVVYPNYLSLGQFIQIGDVVDKLDHSGLVQLEEVAERQHERLLALGHVCQGLQHFGE